MPALQRQSRSAAAASAWSRFARGRRREIRARGAIGVGGIATACSVPVPDQPVDHAEVPTPAALGKAGCSTGEAVGDEVEDARARRRHSLRRRAGEPEAPSAPRGPANAPGARSTMRSTMPRVVNV